MKPVLLMAVFFLGSLLPMCCCCSTIPEMTANPTNNSNLISPSTPTIDAHLALTSTAIINTNFTITSTPTNKINLTITSTPTITQLPPIILPSPTRTLEPTKTPNVIVNVSGLLGKHVTEVENILGSTIEINPINDPFDSLTGGEYRDYELNGLLVFIGYDQNGVARMFQVLEGLDSYNYSVSQWNQILPLFGVYLTTSPDRTAPAAVYWDNSNGLFIAVVASSSSGRPVWTVQIAQAAYAP